MTSQPRTSAPANARHPSEARPVHFDGVICFGGEDWWYHNRGHFDMQMMRELSREVPVLYINSIGMRVPQLREGAMFIRRILRKLRSLRRGLVRVRDRFWVITPLAGPGGIGRAVTRAMLPRQVRRAARRIGISHPLVWVACPPGAPYINVLGAVGVVYQRTDRYEEFANVDRTEIEGFHRMLKAEAVVTVYCSRSLQMEESNDEQSTIFVDHGVDFDRFSVAGSDREEPPDLQEIGRPRVGFVGGIDDHTFDPSLFLEVAQRLSDVDFVLVGTCSLPENWCRLPNVHLLGQRPYEQVPAYMAWCDVLIMPWNDSPWIKACNPVKLKEYLATGRPVVSTPFDELAHYEGFVNIACDAGSFADAIRHALNAPGDASRRRARVRAHTWSAKAGEMLESLGARGIEIGRSC